MQRASSDAIGQHMHIDRRRFLVSFIIASVGTLAVRTGVAADPADSAIDPADWRSVLETMFPHARIDHALYSLPAGALAAAAEKDPTTRRLLDDGWRSLSVAAGGAWASATGESRMRALKAIVGTPFFAVLRQTMVFTFYASPKVWQAFGYEGDAWSFGGYVGKELNSIDWLPNPPATPGA